MSAKEAYQKQAVTSSVNLPDPMKYLEPFANLGPRPTCSENEKRAAAFAKEKMQALGLQVQEDRFTCNPKMFRPHMAIFLFVVALGVLPVILPNGVGFILAALGCFYARKLYTDLLHNKKTIIHTVLPKLPCRNIIGKINPTGEVKNRIVLMSHLDSALCSPIFGEKMVRSLKTNILLDRILFFSMGVLYLAAAITGNDYLYYAAIGLSLYVVGSLVVLLYSEMFSPISPGANDNGSGVAGVLTMAESLAKSPLQNTEVWCVCLGAEEPGASGSYNLFENHREELLKSYMINIDSVAVGSPRYLVNEGYTEEYRCDAEMIQILDELAKSRPELRLAPYAFKGWGGYTDCTHMLRSGCKAITLVATEPDGLIKNWHTLRDTLDGIQKDTYNNVLDAVNHLVHTLDHKHSA